MNDNTNLQQRIDSDSALCKQMKEAMSDAATYANVLGQLESADEHVGNIPQKIKMATYALNMTLQIIGEQVMKFSDEFTDCYLKGIDLYKLSKTRNIISHAYEAINMDVIKALVNNYLPDIEYGIEMFEIDRLKNNCYVNNTL